MGEGEKKRKKKEDSSQDQAKVWNFGFFGMETTLIMELNGSMEL